MNKIRFLHIPKTAGTSFNQCIRHVIDVNEDECFTFGGDTQRDLDRFKEMETSQRERIVLVTGHSPRITGNADIDKYPIITFLRNPINRTKSFCQHVSEGKSSHLLKRFPPDKFDLDAFLNSGIGELSNLQTKFIIGDQNYVLPQENESALVEKTLGVLDSIKCFGITEKFDISLLLFRNQLNWKRYPVYRSLNRENRTKLIVYNQSQIDKIKELNNIDLQVYAKAVDLFNDRVSHIIASYKTEIRRFNRIQKIFYMIDAPIQLLKNITKYFIR